MKHCRTAMASLIMKLTSSLRKMKAQWDHMTMASTCISETNNHNISPFNCGQMTRTLKRATFVWLPSRQMLHKSSIRLLTLLTTWPSLTKLKIPMALLITQNRIKPYKYHNHRSLTSPKYSGKMLLSSALDTSTTKNSILWVWLTSSQVGSGTK